MVMELNRIHDDLWEIPRSGGMRVPGRIYADRALLEEVRGEGGLQQVVNVAHLPGIVGYSLAMPDIHWGYGFPIGGVAATDPEEGGVISPRGVGYDINCGVRLMRSSLFYRDVKPHLQQLADQLFKNVPSGVGRSGHYRFDAKELRRLLGEGSRYLLGRGLADARDIEYTEA